MAFKFECNNVIPGCEGVVTGESREAVFEAATDHAATTHGMDQLPDDIAEQVKAATLPFHDLPR